MIDQATGEALLVWSVRLAVGCYIARLLIANFQVIGRVPSRGATVIWSVGCIAYLAHVICAFAFAHQWSHTEAWEHTAMETERLTGMRRGEGLWVNYVFTLIWIGDVVRINIASRRGQRTQRRADIVVHLVFAFIGFNATVVFGPDLYRWLAVPVGLALVLAWQIGRPRRSVDQSGG